MSNFPTDAKARKGIPLTTGVFDYFPDALAEVAKVSVAGNEQHNPGQPLHWAKEKSTDHADCIARHLLERGKFDVDGFRHSAKLAWRALANLQIEMDRYYKYYGGQKVSAPSPLEAPPGDGLGTSLHPISAVAYCDDHKLNYYVATGCLGCKDRNTA